MPAAAHIGNSIHDMLGECARENEPALRRVLGEGRPVLNYEWPAGLRPRDHSGRYLEHYIPVHDEQGRVKWVGTIVIDIEQPKVISPLVEQQVQAELERKQREVLLIFNKLAVSRRLHRFFDELPQTMRQFVLHDFGVLIFADLQTDTFGAFGLGIDIGTDLLNREDSSAVVSLFDHSDDTVRAMAGEDIRLLAPTLAAVLLQNRVKESCCIALKSCDRTIGILILCRTDTGSFDNRDIELARQLGAGIVLAMENFLANKALRSEQAKLRLLNLVNSALITSKDSAGLISAPALPGWRSRTGLRRATDLQWREPPSGIRFIAGDGDPVAE